MNFSNLGSELADLINVSTLYSLKFEYCTRIGPFLLALAATFRQSTGLKILTVRTDNNDMASRKYYTSPPLAALLRSFEGLEELELDLPVPGPIAEKESFSPHRDSLKGLLVRFEMMICAHSYWITRIAQILGQCPNVQQFAYLPQVPNLGKVEECQVPCSVPTVSRGVLDSIVASPNIRVLRLLYSPGLTDAERALREEPEWAEKAARIAHGFATQVLRYIALRGSNVSLLALSPVSRWKQDRCDSNGHYYPHYYYRRETSAVCDNGVITNAVPIRDCLVEFPDATILTMF
jgi:hypothetical protein